MEITNQSLDWDSEDLVLWRQFLQSRTGSRLLPKLADSAPHLLHKGDTNEILIANGKLIGFQMAIASLLALAFPPPVEKDNSAAYPALDDDEAWADGQSVKPLTP